MIRWIRSAPKTALHLGILAVAVLSTAQLVAAAGLITDRGVFPSYESTYTASDQAGRGASPFFPQSLADRNPSTLWHATGSEAWITIDLGAGKEQAFSYLRARPRPGSPRLFWREAQLEGSWDGVSFEVITQVNQISPPTAGGWFIWSLGNPNKYRFYALVIENSHGGPLSFSDLELLTTLPLVQRLVPWWGDAPGDNRKLPRYRSSPYLEGFPLDHLTDADPDTFWHATGSEGWITIDLGAGNEQAFSYLRARPRPGLPQQFWKEAQLEGSRDGVSFEVISQVNQASLPTDGGWLMWSFDNPSKYRFYRLVMKNPQSGGNIAFSELGLLTTLPLVQRLVPWWGDTPGDNRDMLQYWSSPHLESSPPTRLFDTDPATFWHATGPEGWIMINLGAGNERAFRYLRARPRPGLPQQFWKEAQLEGSRDGVSFEVISQVNQLRPPTTEGWLIWSFDNPSKYRFYRLVMKNPQSGGHIAFSELELSSAR